MKCTLTLLVLGFLTANGFAVQRFALGHGTGSGFSCNESRQKAYAACMTWLSETSGKVDVVEEPSCPQGFCTCSGSGVAQSSCLGYAKFEDKQACPAGKERFKFETATSSGFTCEEAQHKAITALYENMGKFSADNRVAGFTFRPCSFSGSGICQASCGASVRYLDCEP